MQMAVFTKKLTLRTSHGQVDMLEIIDMFRKTKLNFPDLFGKSFPICQEAVGCRHQESPGHRVVDKLDKLYRRVFDILENVEICFAIGSCSKSATTRQLAFIAHRHAWVYRLHMYRICFVLLTRSLPISVYSVITVWGFTLHGLFGCSYVLVEHLLHRNHYHITNY